MCTADGDSRHTHVIESGDQAVGDDRGVDQTLDDTFRTSEQEGAGGTRGGAHQAVREDVGIDVL